MRPSAALLVAATGVAACGQATPLYDDPTIRARLAELSPAALPAPPPDPTNRYADDSAAALLGQRFFFDTSFSGPLLDSDNDGTQGTLGKVGDTGKVACAGCHIPAAGFSDNRSPRGQVSLASSWTTRKARSLLDVGQAKILMWDGRHDALYNQPFEPLEDAREMNSSRLFLAEQIFATVRAQYEAVFGPMPPLDDATRFPALDPAHAGCESLATSAPCHGRPGDHAEYDSMVPADQQAVTQVAVNFGKALGAYERKLSCGESPFDRWVQGDESAIPEAAKMGAALFVGKAGCAACHTGPFLTDQGFHNIGLMPVSVAFSIYDPNDQGEAAGLAALLTDPLNSAGFYSDGTDGRIPASVPASAAGSFRTPSLRCVAMRPSFMHTGQLRTLDDVVRFFNRGGDTSGFPGVSENHPRNLSLDEEADLVAFLDSLTGPGPDPSLLSAPAP